jgi:hypothetical protein
VVMDSGARPSGRPGNDIGVDDAATRLLHCGNRRIERRAGIVRVRGLAQVRELRRAVGRCAEHRQQRHQGVERARPRSCVSP